MAGHSLKMLKNFNGSSTTFAEFYNWNRVKVRYCDGGSFSGDVDEHVEVTLENSNQVYI